MASAVFGLVQLIVHGVVTARRLEFVYNPGLAAVLLGHVPLGIWYMLEVKRQRLMHWWAWPLTVVYMAFFAGGVMRQLGYGVLSPRGSKYPFAPEGMTR